MDTFLGNWMLKMTPSQRDHIVDEGVFRLHLCITPGEKIYTIQLTTFLLVPELPAPIVLVQESKELAFIVFSIYIESTVDKLYKSSLKKRFQALNHIRAVLDKYIKF